MVVVAIIGILSAVAIPNFRTYQAKSKASEARIQLTAVYQAATSLYNDYDTYASCLTWAGFETPTNNYYAVGFGADNTGRNADVRTAAGSAGACPNGQFSFNATREVANALVAATSLTAANAVAATGISFTAEALGIISKDRRTPATADQWTITDTKAFANPRRGY